MSREDGAGMGRFVNPDNSAFRVTLNSKIYVDKTDEYSCAVTPQVRQTGNRLSGLAGTAYASLLT